MAINRVIADEFFSACEGLQAAIDSDDEEACLTARARWRNAYKAYNSLDQDDETPFDEADDDPDEDEHGEE